MADRNRDEELTGQGREDDTPPEGYGGEEGYGADEKAGKTGKKGGSAPQTDPEVAPEPASERPKR